MRQVICLQCGKSFTENDNNPAIHYSSPSLLCLHCKAYNKKEIGDWYQTSSGEYKQKGIE